MASQGGESRLAQMQVSLNKIFAITYWKMSVIHMLDTDDDVGGRFALNKRIIGKRNQIVLYKEF